MADAAMGGLGEFPEALASALAQRGQRLLEEVDDAVEAGEISLQVRRGRRQRFDRSEEHDEVGQEHDQIAGGDLAVDHLEVSIEITGIPVQSGDSTKIGRPLVEGAKVIGEVVLEDLPLNPYTFVIQELSKEELRVLFGKINP